MSSAIQTETNNVSTTTQPASERVAQFIRRRPLWAIGLPVLLGGWVLALAASNWHMTPSVVFLWFGWAGVLGATYYLRAAGGALARDRRTKASVADFEPTSSSRQELEREKVSLLRAIKEIEFDRDLGKMSDADATEITRVYRARAIKVIKALEAKGGDRNDSVSLRERMEEDLRARLLMNAGLETKSRRNGKSPPATKERNEESS